ncbi:hypothetical protein QI102_08380 [Staphylococcus saprophyticus]|uniref:hypothetical protein n=2 Tax=Staphylococcus saprophyticus TaxID=29385 RepID=UPI0008534DA7|nr:hypothetical protein [Staphylococcus saprophyticus]MDW4280210.1 hypothetical protein [Staphylococcus saprophyticus]MDW4294914.1 hypothetical protein [Staphylococcus saprophyticus]MDW4326659.1 hypothetical protein [Staphylococcus saprophyticus]MDW4346603.1 hypothetical protein [Staphylococcus saprophyticus]MDW4370993.1 hypothetical protein [Staphylococcus saprophyticus]
MKNKKIISIVFMLILLPPITVGIGVTKFPFVSNINGDSNSWIGFWGSFLGSIIGTLGVIYVAFIQNKNQIYQLKVELNEIKKENNKTRELDKLKYRQDIIKGYLKELIEYRSLFINKAALANNKLDLLYYYKHDESFWVEKNEFIENSTASILLNDYEQIDNMYSSLKMMHNNFIIFKNPESYKLPRLSNEYIQLLNEINLQSFKSKYRSSVNYEGKLFVLTSHLKEIDDVYNCVSDLLIELIKEYDKV